MIEAVHQGLLTRGNLKGFDDNSDLAITVWNSVYATPPAGPRTLAGAKEPAPPPHDALTPPDIPRISPRGLIRQGAPTALQTSEYMVGNVAVGIILPESDGSRDRDTEDWSSSRQDDVAARIGNALNWWAQREPKARLSFTWDVKRGVPTGYEPITRPQSDEGLWIGEVMSRLGYSSGSYFTSARAYVNNLRSTAHADWAFAIFVVDDANDADHMFSNGYFAYAYVGGPFLVMTYNNDGYGIQNMDAVVAHEIGHIFYALDEYQSAGIPCSTTSGYLNAPNSNSEYPFPGSCGLNVSSIMRGQIAPFAAGAVASSTRAELGWRDSTGAGILDPVNTTVSVAVNPSSSYTAGDGDVALRYRGQAGDTPWTSPSRGSISINTITGVQYQIDDSGSWRDATPDDGAWMGSSEAFSINTGPISPGPHTVTIRATNSACTLSNVCNSATITKIEQVVARAALHLEYLPLILNRGNGAAP